MITDRPNPDEFPEHYAKYIARVPQGDIISTLETQLRDAAAMLGAIPDERGTLRYQPGKWSINDIVVHLSDAERIFTYRALRFARGDRTALPGFAENDYAAAAGADGRDLHELVEEFATVRRATLSLLRSFDPEVWTRRGISNGAEVSVRAFAYIMAGHVLHHLGVIQERYIK